MDTSYKAHMTPRRILLLAFATLTACGDPAEEACEVMAQCEGYDMDTCLEAWSFWDQADCEKATDRVQTCIARDGECVDGEMDSTACKTEWQALTSCFGGDWDYADTP